MTRMIKAIQVLFTIGISGGAMALGTGCTSATTPTQANNDAIHSDVTDVRPVQTAAYQPPLYDNSTNIPTAPQPVSSEAVADAPASRYSPVVSTTPTAGSKANGKTHTVRHGETLFSIAKSVLGDGKKWKQIAAANPGVSPSKLKVGQVLVMPV